MPTGIKNISLDAQSLPDPYDGILAPGAEAIVADSATAVLAALGGTPQVVRNYQLRTVATGAALTIHGARNVDEYMSATGAASALRQTTRVDVSAASITLTLADGGFAGQRKRFYEAVPGGANVCTVVPATMGEGKANVQLKALGAFAELEWQIGATSQVPSQYGWKVVALGGVTGGGATVT